MHKIERINVMFALVYVLALQWSLIGCQMTKMNLLQTQTFFIEKVMNEDHNALELQRFLAFYPPRLDFGAWAIGTPRSHTVTLVNKNANRSVHLSSISGTSSHFYSSFFEDKVVPPQGNTTFNVVFLPRSNGDVETNLLIHTSFGQTKLPVRGEGRDCPYRLRSLEGIKVPYNATIKQEIFMYNPHPNPIQILEVYSSGGQFQLELPSGGQEGPQTLWEIPPYSSKPIIRIRFHAAQSGNHTGYIRIKINSIDEATEEDSTLIVPVEFEVLTGYGIYSPSPIIDFGETTTDSAAKIIKVNLTNSGKKKVDVVDFRLNNVANIVVLDKFNLTLILNSEKAKEDTIIDGEMIITMQSRQYSNQYMEVSINIRAEIYKGSLEFDRSNAVFIMHRRDSKQNQRDFMVRNTFDVPVAITDVKAADNDTKLFSLLNFEPRIIGSGEEANLFQVLILNDSINFETILTITTNLSSYQSPLVVCTGLLKIYASIDASSNVSRSAGKQVLDFGVIPYGHFSYYGYIHIENPNPVPINILSWNFTKPDGIHSKSVFLGYTNTGVTTGSKNLSGTERFSLLRSLPAKSTVTFQLSLKSYNTSLCRGTFRIKSENEELEILVKFTTVRGRLEVDQSRLHFSECFPGKRCSADISIHSTFLKPMRVKSITRSVPGLDFEYHTISQNGLPEIAPSTVTDIGRIHFDPKFVCEKNCYIPHEQDFDMGPYTNSELDFNVTELRRRTESFRQFKWSLQTIAFTLDTSEVKRFEFNTTIDVIWPKFVKESQKFPAIEVGQVHNGLIYVTNPSNEFVQVEIGLVDSAKTKAAAQSLPLEVLDVCVNCEPTDKTVFFLGHKADYPSAHIIPPNSFLEVPVRFVGKEMGTFSTLLHIKNNLTSYEAVWIIGKAVQPQFRFGNRKPGSNTPLLFDINEKYHLMFCEKAKRSEEQISIITKRTFTARNTGEVPIRIDTFHIGDRICEGYGFKVLDCTSFELMANSSKKVDIAFTPDFTMTRVTRPLILGTNLSYTVNYTLLATIPTTCVEKCAKSLMRPFWEYHIKAMSLVMLIVAFMFVLISAYFDSKKILNDHIKNFSKYKGPTQPPLDLRNIGMKSTIGTEDTTSICAVGVGCSGGGTSSCEKSQSKMMVTNATNSVKKRNAKRNCFPNTVSKEKRWADEFVKNISAISRSSPDANNATPVAPVVTASIEMARTSPVSTNSSAINKTTQTAAATTTATVTASKSPKEEKLQPSKKINKEINSIDGNSTSSGRHTPEKTDKEHSDRRSDAKQEIIQSAVSPDVRKTKSSVRKTKPTQIGSSASECSFEEQVKVKDHNFVKSPNNICGPERATERSNKLSKYQKEKTDYSERPHNSEKKGNSSFNQLHTHRQTHQISPNVDDLRTRPTQMPTEINRENESPIKSMSKGTTSAQRKYGKTPGRERKKESNQSKRPDRKAPKFKGNAFQFAAPIVGANGLFGGCNNNTWDPNQATFSHVVSQNNIVSGAINMEPPNNGYKQKSYMEEQQDTNNNGHEWNEADLKNHETFDLEPDPKRNLMVLGPIGTRKSPLSTPAWEPLSPAPNMTDNLNNAANKSLFSNNFSFGSNLEYNTNENQQQYFGEYSSNLLNHFFYLSQQNPNNWHANGSDYVAPQMRDQMHRPTTGWTSEGRSWTPMGYQEDSTSMLANKQNAWTRPQIVRPPPGLSLRKSNSPGHKVLTDNGQTSVAPLPQQPKDSNVNIQPFDPFDSFRVWSSSLNWDKSGEKK